MISVKTWRTFGFDLSKLVGFKTENIKFKETSRYTADLRLQNLSIWVDVLKWSSQVVNSVMFLLRASADGLVIEGGIYWMAMRNNPKLWTGLS